MFDGYPRNGTQWFVGTLSGPSVSFRPLILDNYRGVCRHVTRYLYSLKNRNLTWV